MQNPKQALSKRALIAGCGDLGLRCARILKDAGFEVTGARRNVSFLPDWIEPLTLDVTSASQCGVLANTTFDLVIVALTARGEEGYRSVYVEGIKNLLSALCDKPLILFASSTSVYAQTDGFWIDENSPTEPTGFAGRTILEAEQLLERSVFPFSAIRLSGLYGGGRSNHLLKALESGQICPAEPVKYSNRVHIDDAARLVVHLANRYFAGEQLESIYLAADSNPAPLREIMEWLAAESGIEVSALEESYIAKRGGNRRCSNQRVKSTGYVFEYDHYSSGYRA